MGTSRTPCAPYRGDWLSLAHSRPHGHKVCCVMGIEGRIALRVLDDYDIPVPCLHATKDYLPSSRGLYRGAARCRDVHTTMQPLFVVYGMHPHPIAGGGLPLHRKLKHTVRRSSLLTIRVDGRRFPRRQSCGWMRQRGVWSAWKLLVCTSFLELSLQQGSQTQLLPASHMAGDLLIEEGEVRIMRKPLDRKSTRL